MIRKEGFRIDNIHYIFCSDEFLRRINIKHLSHKSYTDIITFDLSREKKKLNAEIYISVDRVRDNAVLYKVPFYNELSRVMIHGILHLCGYSDKSQADIQMMRRKENIYIDRLRIK